MPQMAPLNWLTLFIFFTLYIMIFSSMNYFFFLKTPIKSSTKVKKIFQNWLW
uniref:ATP synthase complex subunit 8 n=1 Tax=Cryptocephalus celtibericus TaxID=1425551 RepID=A0A3G1GNR7_9CUCU|nr:ATP synthase F0 subunit 8 [Cryptocephalus celtibericus]